MRNYHKGRVHTLLTADAKLSAPQGVRGSHPLLSAIGSRFRNRSEPPEPTLTGLEPNVKILVLRA